LLHTDGLTTRPRHNYAYTQIGNNLSGRVSRALLTCDGHVVAETAWD
jgi:hypothetical protein